jgi:hypothetical protein
MDKEHQSRQARLQEIQAKKEKLAELRRNRQLLKDQEQKTRLSISDRSNVTLPVDPDTPLLTD